MFNPRDEKVIDCWYALLKSAAGQAEYVYKKSRENLDNLEIVNLGWGIETMKPGLDQGLLGQNKQLLCVTNSILKGFNMYIVARDYGVNLSVAWFLTLEPEIWDKKTSTLKTESGKEIFLDFDLFRPGRAACICFIRPPVCARSCSGFNEKIKTGFDNAGNKKQRIFAGGIMKSRQTY